MAKLQVREFGGTNEHEVTTLPDDAPGDVLAVTDTHVLTDSSMTSYSMTSYSMTSYSMTSYSMTSYSMTSYSMTSYSISQGGM